MLGSIYSICILVILIITNAIVWKDNIHHLKSLLNPPIKHKTGMKSIKQQISFEIHPISINTVLEMHLHKPSYEELNDFNFFDALICDK